MLTTLAVANYRSLHDVALNLHGIDVITGANGSGKSSLYRALRLLAGSAGSSLIGTLAAEGGLDSALWAGPENLNGARRRGEPVQGVRRRGVINLQLGFATDEWGYLLDLGLPQQASGYQSAFLRDPEIKREVVFAGQQLRPATTLVKRLRSLVQTREDGRGWRELSRGLAPWHSMLTELADPRYAPELFTVRQEIRSWRFYDGFRSDPAAPARQPRVGTRTPVLADDGSDLGAALQTIIEGGGQELSATIADAFDGARVSVDVRDGVFEPLLEQPGMLRPMRAAELSDGTLRYLLWSAALLSVTPPKLMVLNEPETSLHPDLLPALARLIITAGRYTQLIIVTHSPLLLAALDEAAAGAAREVHRHTLVKDLSETSIEGQGMLTRPAWEWGSRR